MVLAGDSGVLCSVLLGWKVDSYSGGAAAIGFSAIKILDAMNISLVELMDRMIKNYPTLLAVGACILIVVFSIISFGVSLRIMRKKQF